MKKKLILAGIVLLLVDAVVSWYFIIYRGNNLQINPFGKSKVTVVPSVTPKIQPSIYLPAAKNALAWLEKQKDERGIYYFSRSCSSGTSCDQINKSGQSGHYGLAAIWGRYKYYSQNRTMADLTIINKDLAAYTDASKIGVVQNDHWNCRLMYELWSDKAFSAEQKQQLEQICWQSLYYHPKDLPTTSESFSYNKAAKRAVTAAVVAANEEGLAGMYAPYASDFVARFVWRQNPEDLTQANQYFNKAVAWWNSNKAVIGGENYCLLGVAAVDMAQVTKKTDYLDFAKDLFNSKKAADKPLSPVCAVWAKELERLDNNTEYLSYMLKINGFWLKTGQDKDGSFFSLLANGIDLNSEKTIRLNGLVVGVLSL